MKQSRRTFLKTSAIGAAGLAIGGRGMSSKSYANIIGSNDRINVALIGMGRRLEAFVVPISKKENNARLTYLCDVMEDRRVKGAERFSKVLDYTPKLENDVRRIHDAKDVDVLIHATPDHWHAPGACYAVQAGKHVYVEKPCSHNPREGELLIEIQKKHNKVIQVGNQYRSSKKTIEIINEIHNGIIGETYESICFYTAGRGEVPVAKLAPVPKGLDWDLFQGPAPRQKYMDNTWDYNWHWYGWAFGTAESGNNMIHRFDLARWAMQLDFPERIDAVASKNHFIDDGWTVYDTMSTTIRFANNKVIKGDCKSRNGYKTYGAANGVVVFGSKGSVFLSGTGYKLYDREGKLIKEDDSNVDLVDLHFNNFLETIRGKEKVTSPIDEAEKSTLLCHLSNIAYRTGRNFDINTNNGQALDNEALKLWGREYEPGWEIKV